MEHWEDVGPPRLYVVSLGEAKFDWRKQTFWAVSVHVNVATCIWTMLATHLTTMSLTVPHLLFFIMCSKGLVEKISTILSTKNTYVHKSPEEILLEMKIWKLSLLNELLSQLSEEKLCFTEVSIERSTPHCWHASYLRESTAKKEISWTVLTPTRLKCSPRTYVILCLKNIVYFWGQKSHLPYSGPLQPDPAHVVVRDLHKLCQAKHSRARCHRQLFNAHLCSREKIRWSLSLKRV